MTNAIVTGAGRGIGRAIAERLAADGARVTLVARTRHEPDDTAEAVERRGGAAVVVAADVRDAAAAEGVAAAAGDVDLLVNNAGTLAAIGPPWEVDTDAWWLDVETSLRGAYLCSHAVLPTMVARRRGTIVNVSSGSALRPEPYTSGYRAGKAAVATFTEDLAAAGREHGVAAFAVAPGFVQTAMTDQLRNSAAGRRWKPEAQVARPVDAERTADLVARLATGEALALSGRFLHALDDLDELLARIAEIEADDLYALRLRRLSR